MNANGFKADGLNIAVVGATGAVGRDLLAVIGRSNLPVAGFRLFASASSKGEVIEVNGRSHRVSVLPPVGDLSAVFDGIDVAFLAATSAVAKSMIPVLQEIDVPVIDIGAAHADKAPIMVAQVSMEPVADFPETRVMCSPSAPAVVVSTVLGPLANRGAISVRGTIMLSASTAGKAGAEELSAQVVSLFNSKTPPRTVFPTGLAFDVLSQLGDVVEGWTTTERRVALEIADVLGWEPSAALTSVVLAPMFAGIAADLTIEFDHVFNLDDVKQVLDEAPGIRIGDPVPGPRRVAGDSAIYVGRIRADPDPHRLHLWVTADNLRVGATANALAIALALWGEGYL
jgi:aspartate-semialdehyde dehydrogenase